MRGMRNARKSIGLEEASLRALDRDLDLGDSPRIEPVSVTEAGVESPAEPTLSGDPTFTPSLISNCKQMAWTLDPGMSIFFEGVASARGAEEFRVLRSRLYRLRKQQTLKSLLIASAVPKEGRSFVAINLAQVLALQAGCRVLLIDADLRNPRLHSAFRTCAGPGLSEYLLRDPEEFSIMQRGSCEGLFMIPAGKSIHGQTELIANGRFQHLLDQVESFFDWIIVDSPASLPVTDASLLSNSCDGVLLVVRSHATPYDVVRKAQERFSEESIVGALLNRIDEESTNRLGHGSKLRVANTEGQ